MSMRNFTNIRENSAKRAFTLAETMIAVAIITLAVAGPLFTASRSIVAAEIANQRLTAAFLAQEGIEYVRAMRDNEYLKYRQSDTAWTAFLTGNDAASITQCRATTLAPDKTCALDPLSPMGTGNTSSIRTCTYTGCPGRPLYLMNGLYTLNSGGVLTPFTRTIQVVDIPGTVDPAPPATPYPDKRIVSKVSWNFHGRLYTITVTDHLTPWQ